MIDPGNFLLGMTWALALFVPWSIALRQALARTPRSRRRIGLAFSLWLSGAALAAAMVTSVVFDIGQAGLTLTTGLAGFGVAGLTVAGWLAAVDGRRMA